MPNVNGSVIFSILFLRLLTQNIRLEDGIGKKFGKPGSLILLSISSIPTANRLEVITRSMYTRTYIVAAFTYRPYSPFLACESLSI